MNPELLNLVKSDWRPPTKFPKLVGKAREIAFDVETYDPHLLDSGPGAIRKDGYVCGFSVATDDGFKGYYPIRHEGGDNLENPDAAIKWLGDQLYDDTPKIGANILYDLIWLKCDLDINVGGKKYDVQIAEPLLDENRHIYQLDALANEYLEEGKRESTLYEAGKYLLGIKGKGNTGEEQVEDIIRQVKSRLWELPARYVGVYGEYDANLPIKIFNLQKKKLSEVGLWKLFEEIETPLVDLLLEMWLKGVPVDVDRAEQTRDELSRDFDNTIRKIKRRVGFTPDVWAAEDIAKACNKLGLDYNLTDKYNLSFTAQWLSEQEHEFFKLLLKARQLDRCGGVFIESKILNMMTDDNRIHPQFWQVKSERYGTTSGRFSSSNPNAQQFPKRNEELAKKVRSILTAEEGLQWAKFDHSQQEFRLTVHFATLLKLTGALEAQQKYISDPDTDFHQMVADTTNLKRKLAKNLNLGLSYGMGPKKFSETYNKTLSEARKLYKQYHNGLPFIKQLTQRCERVAKNRKYVKTILGRHCHFDLYGPPKWEKGMIPKKFKEAIEEFGEPVVLYFTYRAMNRVIQGSAADMIKKNMLDCYEAGYVPALTVHDELDFIDIENSKQTDEIHDIMVNSIILKVPNKVDIEIGENWGELEEVF